MPWLLVGNDVVPHGGMEVANHALARFLAARGPLHLVTHRASPDLAALPTVTVHRVWRPFGWDFLGSPLLSRAGEREWRRLGPGRVHAMVNGGNCPIGAANWVHYVHAAFAPMIAGSVVRRAKAWALDKRDRRDEARALGRARLVVCNSRRTRADVIERLGVEPSRAHVVYYGSDPVAFAPVDAETRRGAKRAFGLAPDRPVVGFVGALGDRRKAFDTVFRAWTGLCGRQDWDADLLVAGAGAELPAWQRRAQEAGLQGRVRFLGYRDDMPAVFAALDVLVHPARYEAYGLVVREALCCGVPALVSATAGAAEHYPADLSELLITNPDDPNELADRLRAWRCDSARFCRLVEPVSAALRARTWDVMAGEIEALVAGAGPER